MNEPDTEQDKQKRKTVIEWINLLMTIVLILAVLKLTYEVTTGGRIMKIELNSDCNGEITYKGNRIGSLADIDLSNPNANITKFEEQIKKAVKEKDNIDVEKLE